MRTITDALKSEQPEPYAFPGQYVNPLRLGRLARRYEDDGPDTEFDTCPGVDIEPDPEAPPELDADADAEIDRLVEALAHRLET